MKGQVFSERAAYSQGPRLVPDCDFVFLLLLVFVFFGFAALPVAQLIKSMNFIASGSEKFKFERLN